MTLYNNGKGKVYLISLIRRK